VAFAEGASADFGEQLFHFGGDAFLHNHFSQKCSEYSGFVWFGFLIYMIF
jgi:hypothetical protein